MKRTYLTSKNVPEQNKESTLKELTLGYLNLKEGFFKQANMNFQLALELDPDCADAWWGLMLAKFEISNEDILYSEPVKYKSAIYLPECEKALALADEDQKKRYQDLLERIYKIKEGEQY